jgi:hypothetical protein
MATLIAYGKGQSVVLQGDHKLAGEHEGSLRLVVRGKDTGVELNFVHWMGAWEITVRPIAPQMPLLLISTGPDASTPQIAIHEVETVERL